jgi:hypothetical protein
VTSAQIAAVLTWVYAAGFGIPAVYVVPYLVRNRELPTFLDLFPMYGGPWSARVEVRTLVVLLISFLVLTLVAAWAGWLVWNGSRAGALLSLVLLPVEAVFWLGFALPIPWVFGVARIAFLALAWKSLD